MEPDVIAVHGLLARYGSLIDQRHAQAWSELFVPDGRLEIANRAPIQGRQGLAAFAENSPVGTHLTGIPELVVSGSVILATSTWIFLDRRAPGSRSGIYRDEILLPSQPGGAPLFICRGIEILPNEYAA
ncbi:nuclear transport factor 2 family protein [Nocardia sp. NBC_01377]|uniref:nuclear transport factor 2 family protein n=1 Tax=Nocardia sp. NBC_01377 TaxID=2903595 RepID=UPI00324E81AA